MEPVTGAPGDQVDPPGQPVVGRPIRTCRPVDRVAHHADGVVIATGGFEWDEAMVRNFLRGPMTSPATPPSNTGDGQKMAMRIGASLGMMREAWRVPVIETGDEVFGAPRRSSVLAERTRPRSLMVNRYGKRFANEAANYNALGGAFHTFDSTRFDYANLPCWLIFDEGHRQRYPVASSLPGSETPPWMAVASTPADLARQLGIAPEGLEATIERFNTFAREGRDPDFGRGDSAYDTWTAIARCPAARRPSGRSTSRPTTPSRSTAARSGPRAGRRPTPMDGS